MNFTISSIVLLLPVAPLLPSKPATALGSIEASLAAVTIQDGAAPQAAHPALFRDLDFAGAKAAAKAEGKMLLLDAMTSWCGPCKVMDRTTWLDPRVVSWVKDNAVAVQLDMDIHEAVKNEIGIKAFPTMVLFKSDSTEFDRAVGLKNPDAMLTWLTGAQNGTREIDSVRARITALDGSDEPKTRLRMALAGQAMDVGATQEAESLAFWLWEREGADDAERTMLHRWRTSVGRNLTQSLIQGSPSASSYALTQKRAREMRLATTENKDVRSEWIALNVALGQTADTALWASMLAAKPEGRTTLKAHQQSVFDLLVDQGLWAAAGHALADPMKEVRFLGDNLGAYDVEPKVEAGNVEPKADAADAPKSMPMIPIGGMKPATSTATAPKKTTIPAIPLGGMKPAKKVEPDAAKEPQDEKTVIPAIPLGGMQPAKKVDADAGTVPQERKTAIPAIPLGGMRPAKPANGTPDMAKNPQKKIAAVPMIPMGGPKPAARPETPEDVAVEVRARLTHQLRHITSRRYAALLAADRKAEADALAQLGLQYAGDDAMRAALVGCALRASEFDARSQRHLEWLNDVARGAGE